MAEISFYDVTIPIFTKRINQLQHCLQKGEQWCKDNNKPTSTLVQARIVDDMHPLPFQVQTVYRMVIYFFMQMEIPGAPDPTSIPVVDSYEAMFKQIEEVQGLLNSVTRDMLEGKASKEVNFGPPGRDPWKFTGLSFVQEFVMVNCKSAFSTPVDGKSMLIKRSLLPHDHRLRYLAERGCSARQAGFSWKGWHVIDDAVLSDVRWEFK